MAKSTPSIEEWENWLDENQDHPSFEKVQGDYLKLVAGGSGVAVPKSEEAKGSAREELFLEALAPPPTPPENKPGDFMRGLASGKDYGDLLIGSALEGAGNVTGIQGLVDYGQGSIESNQAELDKLQGDMIRFEDFTILEDPGKFLDWSQQTLGAAIPITGTGIATGLAAAPVLASLGLGAPAVGLGSAVVSAASMLPFMFGGNREEQKQAIEEGFREEINEWAAAAAAIPQAGFEILAQRFQLRGLGELLNKYIKSEGGFLTKIVKDFAKGTFSEVPTELLQTFTENYQAGGIDYATSPDKVDEYIEVAAGAAIVGGTLQSGAGAFDVGLSRRDARLAAKYGKQMVDGISSGDNVIEGEFIPAGKGTQATYDGPTSELEQISELERIIAETDQNKTQLERRKVRGQFDEQLSLDLEDAPTPTLIPAPVEPPSSLSEEASLEVLKEYALAEERYDNDVSDADIEEVTREQVKSERLEPTPVTEVLKNVEENETDPEFKSLANTLGKRFGELAEVGVPEPKVISGPKEIVTNITGKEIEDDVGGKLLLNENIIYVNPNAQISEGSPFQTVLHEAVHGTLVSTVDIGRQEKNKNTPLGKTVAELDNVQGVIQAYLADRLSPFEPYASSNEQGEKVYDTANIPAELLNTLDPVERSIVAGTNMFRNADETLAWTNTNNEAKRYLEGVPVSEADPISEGGKIRNLWDAFVNWTRKLLGISPRDATALSKVLAVSDNLFSADPNQIAEGMPDFQKRVQAGEVTQPDIKFVKNIIGFLKGDKAKESKSVVQGTTERKGNVYTSTDTAPGPNSYSRLSPKYFLLRKKDAGERYVYPTKVKAKKTISKPKPKKPKPTRKVSKAEERKDGTVELFSTVALLAGENKKSVVAKEVEKLQEKIDAGDKLLSKLDFEYGPNYEDLIALVRRGVESTTSAGNFVTSSDRNKAIEVLSTSNKRKLSISERAMYDYLSGTGRLEDALVTIAFERGEDVSGSDLNVEFSKSKALTLEENTKFAGTGGKNSRLAEEWVLSNLSAGTLDKYNEIVRAYVAKIVLVKGWVVRDKTKIKDKQLVDYGIATKRPPSKDTLSGEVTTFTPEQIKAYEASPEGKARTKRSQDKFIAGLAIGDVESDIFTELKKREEARSKKLNSLKKAQVLEEYVNELSGQVTLNYLNKDIVDEFNLPSNAVSQLALPLHPSVIGALQKGDLRFALGLLDARSKGNSVPKDYRDLIKSIAANFPAYLNGVKVEIIPNLKNSLGLDVAGLFDETTDTIKLDSTEGMNSHVLLHEVAHAVLNAVLSNKSHPTTKQLNKLFKETSEILGTEEYGSVSLKEFVAEALSNMEFRHAISSVYPEGGPINSFKRFANIVIEFLNRVLSYVGLGRKEDMVKSGINKIPSVRTIDTKESILSNVGKIVEALLAPTAKSVGITEANSQRPEEVLANIEKIQKAIVESGGTRQDFTDAIVNTFGSVSDTAKEVLLKTQDSQDVAVLAEKYDLGRVGYDIFETMLKQRGAIQAANKNTDIVKEEYISWFKRLKDQAIAAKRDLDALIYSPEFGATIWQVNPLLNKKAALKRYANEPDKIEIWNKQQPYVRRLKANGGMRIYKLMRDHYVDSYKQMQKVMEGRIDEVFGSTPEGIKAAKKLKQEVFAKLFDRSLLEVYFPLTREGRYKVPFIMREGTYSGEDPFAMIMVDSNQEAKRLVSQLEDNSDIDFVYPIVDGKYDSKTFLSNAPPSSFVSQIIKEINANATDKQVAGELVDKIMDLWVSSLPETSFAQSLQNRKNTPGFKVDSFYAFTTKGYDIPVQTVRLEYSARLTQLGDIVKENYVKAVSQKKNQEPEYKLLPVAVEDALLGSKLSAIALIRDRLLRDVQFASNPPTGIAEDIAKNLNQFAFIQSIWMNVSSAVIQMGQIPFVVYPMLAGRYGWNETGSALMEATGLVMRSVDMRSLDAGIDNYVELVKVGKKQEYRIKPSVFKNLSIGVSPEEASKKIQDMEDLLPLITYALATGQLNRTFLQDTLNISEGGREKKGNKVKNAYEVATSVGAAMFNTADRINRQVTLVAAYQLELQRIRDLNKKNKPKGTNDPNTLTPIQMQNAAVKAMYTATETNGGIFLETGPEIAKKHMFRVMAMYKTYGFKMNTLMLNTGVSAIKVMYKGNTVKDKLLRNEALKQFIFVHLHTLFLLGVKGMPLWGIVAAKALIDELVSPEDETAEEKAQDYLANLTPGLNLKELFYKGLINYGLGIDITDRAKLNSLILQQNKWNTRPDFFAFVAQLAVGPSGSTIQNTVKGGLDVYNGETERGIEKMLPPGLANNWKSSFGRLAREGYRSRDGHPIYADVTRGELALQFFGFRPSEVAYRSDMSARYRRMSKAVAEKRADIYKRYREAEAESDAPKMALVMEDREAFNNKEAVKFPGSAILIRSLKDSAYNARRSEGQYVNGVYVPRFMQEYVQKISDDRNRAFNGDTSSNSEYNPILEE